MTARPRCAASETTARVLITAGPYRLSGEWWRQATDGDDNSETNGDGAGPAGRMNTGTCTRQTAPSIACTATRAAAASYLDGYYD